MSTDPNIESLKSELNHKLDMHMRQVELQFDNLERWIQKATDALDKIVELQISIEATRARQEHEREINEKFRSDFRELVNVVSIIKEKTQEIAVKTAFIIGAGVTILNVGLWIAERFI